jgi:hypothetical protein
MLNQVVVRFMADVENFCLERNCFSLIKSGLRPTIRLFTITKIVFHLIR